MLEKIMFLKSTTHQHDRSGSFVLCVVLLGLGLHGCGGGEPADQQPTVAAAEVEFDTHEDTPSPEREVLSAINAFDMPSAAPTSPFNGGAMAHVEGAFAPEHQWPLMPIHMAVLPDGRVMGFGTGTTGKQGSTMQYAVWEPALGYGGDAFTVLPNYFGTDIFCAGQVLIPGSGQLLLVGGDAKVNGVRNYATSDINLFDPAANTLQKSAKSMAFKRWYATAVTLGNGEQIVLGGRDYKNFAGNSTAPATVATYPDMPERRSLNGNWTTLSDVASQYAYGLIGSSWFYPRAWLKPDGDVFILAHNGKTFSLNPYGKGALTEHAKKAAPGTNHLPSVMYAPGKVLSLRKFKKAQVIDFNGAEPAVTSAGTVSALRYWGNATVLADGKVWVSGGSASPNELVNVAYHSELWNPVTNKWSQTATAAKARLYHSSAVLLRDGTVLTGGGGAPGPYTQLNGEIFYPPYLFRRDGSGELFDRPSIHSFTAVAQTWGQSFTFTANKDMQRVTLVRNGSTTHAFNNDTRFHEMSFSQDGNTVTTSIPGDRNMTPPGYYMLFVWNRWGVPSIAEILKVDG